MSQTLKVVSLPATDLKNAAANMRKLADTVESWQGENVTAVVILLRNDQTVQVYGYGARASGLEVQGIITRAGFKVGRDINSVEDEK